MYPKQCACCLKGIIDHSHDICSICGWEDDKVQNSDETYSGGANHDSLLDYRKKFLINNNKWIEHVLITRLEKTGLVKAFYTTNKNSVWKYGKEGAFDNIHNMAATLGIDTNNMVMLNQTHTNGIRVVNALDGGEMVNRPLTQEGFDGMITNEPGLMLCTVEADCVPVYLLDPCKKAIGMVHSGWKGTAGVISVKAVESMINEYGSDPQNIIVVIGPCICKNCYEVGKELIERFQDNYSKNDISKIFTPKSNEKYYLDLAEAIKISLIKSGVKPENISNEGVCTYEKDYLCSWRRDNPVMRSMLTAIMLKK